MTKSMNRQWKESGTTLSFKDWLNREKAKYHNADGNVDTAFTATSPFDSSLFKNSIEQTLSQMRTQNVQTKQTGNAVFGINKTAIIIGGVILLGAILYVVIDKKTKAAK